MKSTIITLALCALLAVPAFAQTPVETSNVRAYDGIIHLGTFDPATGQLDSSTASVKAAGDIIWDNTTASGSFGQFVANEELLDEGDLPDGTLIQSFQVGFATDATAADFIYTFYTNDSFNTVGAPLSTRTGNVATYPISLTGLPGGGFFAFTVDVDVTGDEIVIAGPDLDMDTLTDWGFGVHLVSQNGTAFGPLLTSPGPDPVGAPGANLGVFDVFDPPAFDPGATYIGSFAFTPPLPSQFHMQLIEGAPPAIDVPTSSDYGLLLLVLGLAGAAFLTLRRTL